MFHHGQSETISYTLSYSSGILISFVSPDVLSKRNTPLCLLVNFEFVLPNPQFVPKYM